MTTARSRPTHTTITTATVATILLSAAISPASVTTATIRNLSTFECSEIGTITTAAATAISSVTATEIAGSVGHCLQFWINFLEIFFQKYNLNQSRELIGWLVVADFTWLASRRTATRSLACFIFASVKNAYDVPFDSERPVRPIRWM